MAFRGPGLIPPPAGPQSASKEPTVLFQHATSPTTVVFGPTTPPTANGKLYSVPLMLKFKDGAGAPPKLFNEIWLTPAVFTPKHRRVKGLGARAVEIAKE